MKFEEQARNAKVLGNDVLIKPVKWQTVIEIQSAKSTGDESLVMNCAVKAIRDYVTMADGTPVDPNELSVRAITELVKELANPDGETTVADFTGTPD